MILIASKQQLSSLFQAENVTYKNENRPLISKSRKSNNEVFAWIRAGYFSVKILCLIKQKLNERLQLRSDLL